jgi:ATP-dependent DNA helicase RecQ
MLKVLDVDGAVRRVPGGWVATGEPWHYDQERYARVAAARADEQQAMRDYVATPGCRMEFLLRQLDDRHAEPCGRCDRCAGPFWTDTVAASTLTTAERTLSRPGVEIQPRALWPTGLRAVGVELVGKIPPAEIAEPGRAVGRLSDIGWGPRLRRLLADGAPDQPLPDDLLQALVDVLRQWEWKRRPAAVVTVPSRSRPRLVSSTGERIAAIGRLRSLGALAMAHPDADTSSPAARSNSARRVRALCGAFALTDQQREALAELSGEPVLLVDDLVDSGWTMALAARELRLAGAAAVLPLALALQA